MILVLSENPVGEKGIAALGQALEHNVTLTSLMLGSTATGTQSPRVRRAKKTTVLPRSVHAVP